MRRSISPGGASTRHSALGRIPRMKTFLALPAAMLVASSALAARPMSITDLLTAVRVGDPQLSPDGTVVAYVRTTTDPTTLKRNMDIWVVPADGSGAPKLLVLFEKVGVGGLGELTLPSLNCRQGCSSTKLDNICCCLPRTLIPKSIYPSSKAWGTIHTDWN